MTFISYKKMFKLSKGFYRKGKNCINVTAPRVVKALTNMYKERKLKKRLMRRSWIISINAAAREHNMPYNRLIYGLNHSNVELDRKVLAELGCYEPLTFKAVLDEIKLQTDLVSEDQHRELNAFTNAVAQGLVVLPGEPLPPLEEAKAQGREKPLKYSEGLEVPYTPAEPPTPEKLARYRQMTGWDSDWEEEFWGK